VIDVSVPHRACALTALLLAAPGVAQELVLDDPLTAPYGASQERQGGSFSVAGWNRGDDFESKLIYDLGRTITHGRIEFEMDWYIPTYVHLGSDMSVLGVDNNQSDPGRYMR